MSLRSYRNELLTLIVIWISFSAYFIGHIQGINFQKQKEFEARSNVAHYCHDKGKIEAYPAVMEEGIYCFHLHTDTKKIRKFSIVIEE